MGPDLWDYHMQKGKAENPALQTYQPHNFHMLPEPPKQDSMPVPEELLPQEDLSITWRASTPMQEEPLAPEGLPWASTLVDIPNTQAGNNEPGDQAEEEDVPLIFFDKECFINI